MRHSALALLLALAPAARAASGFGASEGGTSAAEFLKLGADARAAAMGGAVRAATDDASSVYWNPAGLAGLRYRHASVTHGVSYQSTFQDFAAYAQPVEPIFARVVGRERELRPDQVGTLGVALLYQNSGRIAEVDNTGAPTGDGFTPSDMALFVAWGATLSRGLDAGVGLKYVSSKIKGSANAGALDLGARWRTWLPGDIPYAVSLSAHNIGGGLKFREATDPLPLMVVVGQALRPFRFVTFTADITASRDRSTYPRIGTEWRVPMQQGLSAALRAGYDGRLKGTDLGGLSGLCFGGGLGVQRFTFDYAWNPVGELGNAHKVSFSYRF